MVNNFWMLLELDFYALWWWYHLYKNASIIAITNMRRYWFFVINNFISYIIIWIWLIICNVPFSCYNFKISCFTFNKFNILWCFVVYIIVLRLMNLKKSLEKNLCCFSAIKNNVAPLSSSNFPVTLTLLRNSRICLTW